MHAIFVGKTPFITSAALGPAAPAAPATPCAADRVGPDCPRLLINRERAGEGLWGRGFNFDEGCYR